MKRWGMARSYDAAMPDPILLVAAAAATAAGAAGLVRYLRARSAPPIRRAREVRDGEQVRIQGAARELKGGTAGPLSGRKCLKWRVDVEREIRKNKTTYWERHAHGESREDFLVDDGTVAVRVLGAKVELNVAAPWSTSREAAPPAVRDFVAQRGESIDHELRWRERVVLEGDSVTVAGVARWEAGTPNAQTGYRDAARRLVIDAPDLGWIDVR